MAAVLAVLDTHSRYAVYAHAAAQSASAASTSSGASTIQGAGAVMAAAAAAGAASTVVGGEDAADTPAFQLRLVLGLLGLTLLEHALFAALVVGGAVWLQRRRRERPQGGDDTAGTENQGPPAALHPSSSSWHLAQKLLQALLYPAFGRLLVPFIMIWDPTVAVAGVTGALVLSSQWQALHAVVTSAPFADADDAARSSSLQARVALPFVLGLIGRASLRLLLAGRVVALESFLENGRRGEEGSGGGGGGFGL